MESLCKVLHVFLKRSEVKNLSDRFHCHFKTFWITVPEVVLSQGASLSLWSPFPLLHVPALITLVFLLNLVVCLALAPCNSWALLCWGGARQQFSQPYAWLYARGAVDAVGPPHVSELLHSTTDRTLWESGITAVNMYPCHLTAPATGDTGSCADHGYCCGWQHQNMNHSTGPAY